MKTFKMQRSPIMLLIKIVFKIFHFPVIYFVNILKFYRAIIRILYCKNSILKLFIKFGGWPLFFDLTLYRTIAQIFYSLFYYYIFFQAKLYAPSPFEEFGT